MRQTHSPYRLQKVRLTNGREERGGKTPRCWPTTEAMTAAAAAAAAATQRCPRQSAPARAWPGADTTPAYMRLIGSWRWQQWHSAPLQLISRNGAVMSLWSDEMVGREMQFPNGIRVRLTSRRLVRVGHGKVIARLVRGGGGKHGGGVRRPAQRRFSARRADRRDSCSFPSLNVYSADAAFAFT